MIRRTFNSTVNFGHPFRMRGAGGPWPAGIYEIEMDEGTLDDFRLSAQRRATTIYLPGSQPGVTQAVRIAPDALEAALQADEAESGSGPHIEVIPGGQGRQYARKVSLGGYLTPPVLVPLIFAVAVALAALFGPFPMPGSGQRISEIGMDDGQGGRP